MTSDIEFVSFYELHQYILWIKGPPGHQSGGTPPEPYYAPPLLTWRRVLRTIMTRLYSMHQKICSAPGYAPCSVQLQKRCLAQIILHIN